MMTAITLNVDLGIDIATGLQQRLLPCVHQTPPLLLDGSQVQRVHTASLQLLCALFQSRQATGLKTQWTATSPALCQAASVLGLSDTLELPPADAANPPHRPTTAQETAACSTVS